MSRVKVRHFVEKKQKGHTLFYWQPSKALRAAGFTTRRLAEGSNDRGEAIKQAEALNRQLDAWYGGKAVVPNRRGTIPWLIGIYREDERYTGLRDSTRRNYEDYLRVLEQWSERAGHPPIKTVTRKIAKDFYRSLKQTPGQAKNVMIMARVLWNVAMDDGEVDSNPFVKMRIKGCPPRHQVWTDQQISDVIAAAAAEGFMSISLAVALAANTGQREGDILRMTWSQYDGSAITLKQSKTGVLLSVPVTAELKAVFDATKRAAPTMCIHEHTGRPWHPQTFAKEFRKLATVAGVSEALQYRDLRRTAVVRLAEAGCSVPEVAAISGHTIDATTKIMEVYMPRNSVMARNAITKLEEYRSARRTDSEQAAKKLEG
jgi:integrase